MAIKKIISLLLAVVIVTSICCVNVFASDDWSEHWASKNIRDLMFINVINGYEDGSVRPDNSVTRAEFMTMLFKITSVLDEKDNFGVEPPLGYPSLNGYDLDYERRAEALEYFKDKEFDTVYADMQSHWAKNYLGWLEQYFSQKNLPVLQEIFGEDEFCPDAYITREEAALLCVPFIQAPIYKKTLTDITPAYKYSNEIQLLVDAGIINGDENGRFNPKNTITRGETAAILLRLMYEINFRYDYFENRLDYHFGWFQGMPIPIFINMQETYPDLYNLGGSYFGDVLQYVAGWASNVEETEGYVPREKRLELLKKLETDGYPNKPMIYYYYFYDMLYGYNSIYSKEFSTYEELYDKAMVNLKIAIDSVDEAVNNPLDIVELYAYLLYEIPESGDDLEIHYKYLIKMRDLLSDKDVDKSDTSPFSAYDRKKTVDRYFIQLSILLSKYEDAIKAIDGYINDYGEDSVMFNGLKFYCLLQQGANKNQIFDSAKQYTELILTDCEEMSAWEVEDLKRECIWMLKSLMKYDEARSGL